MFDCPIVTVYQMQQAEQEEVRQREANLTALAAIGPRKKRKLDDSSVSMILSHRIWLNNLLTSKD